MKKSLSTIILSTALLTACDEAKKATDGDSNARINPNSELNLNGIDLKDTFSEITILSYKYVKAISLEYDLDGQAQKDLFNLAEELNCQPMGIIVGKLETEKDNEGYHGKWKMNTIHGLEKVIAQDKGGFEMDFYGEGLFYSDDGDTIIENRVNGEPEYFEMAGKWKNDTGKGEMIGIKIQSD